MFKPFQIPYQSPISDLPLVINRSKQYQRDQNFYALSYICLLLSSHVIGQISLEKDIAIGLLTIHMTRRTRHLILRGGWKRKANWSWPGASQVIGHISLQKDIVLILRRGRQRNSGCSWPRPWRNVPENWNDKFTKLPIFWNGNGRDFSEQGLF